MGNSRRLAELVGRVDYLSWRGNPRKAAVKRLFESEDQMNNLGTDSQARRDPAPRNTRAIGRTRAAPSEPATAPQAFDDRADGATEVQETASAGLTTQDDSSPQATADHGAIALRAYERFQMRGAEHGRDEDDWLEAERELNRAGHE